MHKLNFKKIKDTSICIYVQITKFKIELAITKWSPFCNIMCLFTQSEF